MLIYVQLSQPASIKSRLLASQFRSWISSSSSLPDVLYVSRDHRSRDSCLDGFYQCADYQHRHSNMTSSPSVSINLSTSLLYTEAVNDYLLQNDRHYPLHLRRVTTLPQEIKTSISADIQQIWKKMQINCILSAPILIPLRV